MVKTGHIFKVANFFKVSNFNFWHPNSLKVTNFPKFLTTNWPVWQPWHSWSWVIFDHWESPSRGFTFRACVGDLNHGPNRRLFIIINFFFFRPWSLTWEGYNPSQYALSSSFGSFGFRDWGRLFTLGTSLGRWFLLGSRNFFSLTGNWTSHGFSKNFFWVPCSFLCPVTAH